MKPFTDEWRIRVRHLMRSGLGVEDIAVELRCMADDVRLERDRLERLDALDRLYTGRGEA
jgi:hypothetical protein